MTVHVFGASSSPDCSNFALKQTATDHRGACSEAAIHVVQDGFYVDDMLTSTDTVDSAKQLVKEVNLLC